MLSLRIRLFLCIPHLCIPQKISQDHAKITQNDEDFTGETTLADIEKVKNRKEEKEMKARTVAGLMAGSALGIAVGAGIMMMPQTKQMRSAIKKGASELGKNMTGWIK